jgi:uncharacterized protein YcfJ
MKLRIHLALSTAALLLATQAFAQVTLYEGEGFRGRAFATGQEVRDLQRTGFNDRTSSIVVDRGRWQVCDDAGFQGRCAVLTKGSYDSLREAGLQNNISSVRPVQGRGRHGDEIAPPQQVANYEYRRRGNERVFEAPVTNVRAVMGEATQRCWMERQQVQGRGDNSVGGAVAGALIGGILGHQVGGGSGKDAATVAGAVAGGVVGNNMGRDSGGHGGSRDVRKCETTANGKPAYWDVTYNFRGREHHVQMSEAPGQTIAVNGNGLPRQ